jgi:hypothetical protein
MDVVHLHIASERYSDNTMNVFALSHTTSLRWRKVIASKRYSPAEIGNVIALNSYCFSNEGEVIAFDSYRSESMTITIT